MYKSKFTDNKMILSLNSCFYDFFVILTNNPVLLLLAKIPSKVVFES